MLTVMWLGDVVCRVVVQVNGPTVASGVRRVPRDPRLVFRFGDKDVWLFNLVGVSRAPRVDRPVVVVPRARFRGYGWSACVGRGRSGRRCAAAGSAGFSALPWS